MGSKRRIGPFEVEAVGLGCMPLSHAYGTPPERSTAIRLLNEALDIGYDFLDTAALYGFGANEELIGEALHHRRSEYLLASKCGMTGVNGKRVIDGRPATLRRTLEESLRRLQTDVIDLYYLHRWDKSVPIEESVGELGKFVGEGKVRTIGLSEVSAATLRKAHAVHPIAALQNEYSPWSRNPELGVLEATEELGTALVSFSPVARGFLAGAIVNPDDLPDGDIRRAMPRFDNDNFRSNLTILDRFKALAKSAGCSPAQLSLAWVLSRGSHVLAIPGTTSSEHVKENFEARQIRVSGELAVEISQLFAPDVVAGARYAPATLSEIDSEEY